jgi:predicted nucleic acid-binding protein
MIDSSNYRQKHSLPFVRGEGDYAQQKTLTVKTYTIGMRFIDTNVLIYAVCSAPEDAGKKRRALELLEGRDLALSVQVLQEFHVQATRANRSGALTHEEAVLFATSLTRYRVQEITLQVMYSAFQIRERFGLSYWDSAILAAARACGCKTIYSEDFSSEQDYNGVRVVNPFAT